MNGESRCEYGLEEGIRTTSWGSTIYYPFSTVAMATILTTVTVVTALTMGGEESAAIYWGRGCRVCIGETTYCVPQNR